MFRVNKSRKIKIEKSIEPSYDIVIDNEKMRKEQKDLNKESKQSSSETMSSKSSNSIYCFDPDSNKI